MSGNLSMADRFSLLYDSDQHFYSSDESRVRLDNIWTVTVQEVLRWKKITSVLEIGCGLGQRACEIDWTGVKYTGVDVVEACVEASRKLAEEKGKTGMEFLSRDAIADDLPEAELLLMRSVLQHWHNEEVWWFLSRLGQYPWLLVCEDICPRNWDLWTQGKPPVLNGGNLGSVERPWRPVSLMDHPFSLPGILLAIHRTNCEGYKGLFLLEGQGKRNVSSSS